MQTKKNALQNRYTHLQCHHCGRVYDKNTVTTFCPEDHQPLTAQYSLDPLPFEDLNLKNQGMWRFHQFLPIEKEENRIDLGEGGTPLLPLSTLALEYSQSQLWLKDEGGNPTGSFKARGIGMAVSKAKELGVKAMCIPTAGNAGSALAAYCAKAKIEAHIFMPEATPKVFQLDCEVMGAKVTRVKGNISDAAQMMREKNDGSWFDITTLKEPFRLEGKKTMGYEIAEQLQWKLPDVILYPTGGGTGLIGIWKAFQELLALGWVKDIPTRMVAIQGSGCDPVVQSFQNAMDHVPAHSQPKPTIANGLRVPKPFGDRMIMKTIYESKGIAVSISDDAIKEGLGEFAKAEGIFLSPEGAAVWMGYKKLRTEEWIKATDSVVLLNTGSVYKYAENLYE